MKTSIVLNDKIINESLKLTGINNKTEIINKALLELNRTIKRQKLITMAGCGIMDKSFDIDKFRSMSNDR